MKRRQTISTPTLIVDNNVSLAWARAFLKVHEEGDISPLVVVIEDIRKDVPPEVQGIREALDGELEAQRQGLSCQTVANTIFPESLWNPTIDRNALYDRYRSIYGRVRRHPRNRYGVYFQRLIGFGWDQNQENGVNQLEHIIKTWDAGNRRPTALQAAIFDPKRDHSHQRRRGFPCLQQVAFLPEGKEGLSVTGLYATHYMFERAYGNYLGLFHLGRFMAHEMGRNLSKLVCISAPARLDGTKKGLKSLYDQVTAAISSKGFDPMEGS